MAIRIVRTTNNVHRLRIHNSAHMQFVWHNIRWLINFDFCYATGTLEYAISFQLIENHSGKFYHNRCAVWSVVLVCYAINYYFATSPHLYSYVRACLDRSREFLFAYAKALANWCSGLGYSIINTLTFSPFMSYVRYLWTIN